jgi:hypothetical protein
MEGIRDILGGLLLAFAFVSIVFGLTLMTGKMMLQIKHGSTIANNGQKNNTSNNI